MMTLAQNKQKMHYSLYLGKQPIYESYIDDDGTVIYILDSKGNKIDTGDSVETYGLPVEFSACINNKLNEVVWQDYGIDDSTNYAQIVTSKGLLPLKAGSAIWKRSEIGYTDEAKTIPDISTSDYIVKGVADEGLNYDLFLLKRNVK